VGMANLKRWIILDMGDDLPMKFFQSLDRGDFGFPITQPYLFHDEYDFKVPKGACQTMETTNEDDLTILIITTVHAGGAQVTGNLLAPLVVDVATRKGVQLALDDSKYSIRQEINYFKFGLAVQQEASDNGAPGDGAEGAISEPEEATTEQESKVQTGAETPETAEV
jgi:flagellar assembly factor FliW